MSVRDIKKTSKTNTEGKKLAKQILKAKKLAKQILKAKKWKIERKLLTKLK